MRTSWDRFFDERYFTRWYPRDDPETTTAEATGAMRLAGATSGCAALDSACGFGRHAAALSRMGYSVTGVDRSATLLAHAEELFNALENPPRWVQADYTALPFSGQSFDVVISMNTSLGFDSGRDDQQALFEFARVLRPSGDLVIDTNHKGRLVGRDPHERQQEPFGTDGGVLTIETDFDPATGIIRTLHTVDRNGGTDTIEMSRRIYAVDELEEMLRAAGLGSTARFGALDGSPFTEASRLVLVAGFR